MGRRAEAAATGDGERETVLGQEGKLALEAVEHRRDVEGTVLHQAVRGHLASFLAETADRGGLPRFVERDFARWCAEGWPVRAIRGLRGPAIGKPREVSLIVLDRVAKESVMKALLCTRLGPPESLVLTEGLPSPKPSAGEVKLKILVAGINFPDTLIIEGKYQFKPDLPFAPGGEAVARVVELGEGVEGLAVGDRVIACNAFGMLAEEVCLSTSQVFKLAGPKLSDLEAGGFLMTYATSYYALRHRGGLRAGETLAVLGASGGVGLAAVQLGKAMGAKVIACASTDAKLAVCKAQGADILINTRTEKLKDGLKAATNGDGVDVVYDPVGGTQSEEAVRALAWGGRLLVVGFASGSIPQLPLNLTLLKNCAVVGVFWGAYAAREPENFRQDMAELFALVDAGRLKPVISGSFPLARGGEAIRQLADRKAIGKIVVTVG